MMKNNIIQVKDYLTQLQQSICHSLLLEDRAADFSEDTWQHKTGGGGITRIIKHGQIFEKAGVNFSHVYGKRLPASAPARRPELSQQAFQALGLSLVIHPYNPYVPTTHANIRFFTTINT